MQTAVGIGGIEIAVRIDQRSVNVYVDDVFLGAQRLQQPVRLADRIGARIVFRKFAERPSVDRQNALQKYFRPARSGLDTVDRTFDVGRDLPGHAARSQVVGPDHQKQLPGMSRDDGIDPLVQPLGAVRTDAAVLHPAVCEQFGPLAVVRDAVADEDDIAPPRGQHLEDRAALGPVSLLRADMGHGRKYGDP